MVTRWLGRLGVLLGLLWFVMVGSLAYLVVGIFLVLRWLARPQLRVLWLIVAGLLFVGAVLWAAVVEPSWLLPDTRGPTPADRVRAQTDLRNTLVTMLGGLAVLAGAAVGAVNLAATQRMLWRAQVTERFSKAIEQLGMRSLTCVWEPCTRWSRSPATLPSCTGRSWRC